MIHEERQNPATQQPRAFQLSNDIEIEVINQLSATKQSQYCSGRGVQMAASMSTYPMKSSVTSHVIFRGLGDCSPQPQPAAGSSDALKS